MSAVIYGYTREAGVRGLERALSALCRCAAVEVAGWAEGSADWTRSIVCDMAMVERALGPAKFTGTELADRRAALFPRSPLRSTLNASAARAGHLEARNAVQRPAAASHHAANGSSRLFFFRPAGRRFRVW